MKFSQYLKYLLENDRYRLGELATSSDVHASDLSKIVAGKRKCGMKVADQIITGLQEQDRPQALVNWLKDQVSPEYAGLVEIREAAPKESGGVTSTPIEKAMKFLNQEAETNEAVRKLLLAMAELFQRA